MSDPMPACRRLELGPPSNNFIMCIANDAPLDHPDLAGRIVKVSGACPIYIHRTHWKVTTTVKTT